jgi:hypothetical protein
MIEDDKRRQLLREIIAAFEGNGSPVSLHTPQKAKRQGDSFVGSILGRDGRRHPVTLYPVPGVLGIAAVERLATTARDAGGVPIILARAIGREVQSALVEHQLGYLDLAGNCHLELNAGNVVVHVEGRRRVPRPAGSGSLRAGGYRALFVLLADPLLLTHTVRDIGSVAKVSRHAVQSLLARLRDEGVLVRAGRSEHVFTPGGRETCIDRFAAAWVDVLRGELLVGRFRLREKAPRETVAKLEKALRAAGAAFGFGGAVGSSRWIRYLVGNEVTVHIDGWSPDLGRRLGAVPDAQGPLLVFRTMTALDLESSLTETAHPLLVYAELARSPDPRARETARLLLDRIAKGTP